MESRLVDVVERVESLLVCRGLQLAASNEFLSQSIHHDHAVLDEDVRVPFNQTIELVVCIEKTDDRIVDKEQGRRADYSARDGIVFADDRVLHGVRQREQHDEIERVK